MAQMILDIPPTKEPMHELSNILGSILLAANSHLMTQDLDEELREDLEAIAARSEDGRRILQTLRAKRS